MLNLLWSKICEKNATFQLASVGLNHALVACDLTRIHMEGIGLKCHNRFANFAL